MKESLIKRQCIRTTCLTKEMHVACKAGAGTVRGIIHIHIKEIDFNKWTHVRKIKTFRKKKPFIIKHN